MKCVISKPIGTSKKQVGTSCPCFHIVKNQAGGALA